MIKPEASSAFSRVAPFDLEREPTRARDRLAVAALLLALLAITALPYLSAYLLSPSDRHFQGIVFNVPDNVQYFSWLRDHHTQLLVANRLTPEPNEPALFNFLWLVLARVMNFTGLSFPVAFQGLRLLAGASLLLVLFATCARFTRDRAERWTSYLTVVLGAGLGWIWVVVKYLVGLNDVPFPLDIYVFEPNTLMIITAFPHFTIATTLILGIFLCLLSAWKRQSWAFAAAAAVLSLLLTLQHAYDLLIIGLVPAGALGLIALRDQRIPWFRGFTLGLMGLIAVPPAAYFTWLTSQNPLWREVLAQFGNAGVFTPDPFHLIILMGVPLMLTIALIVVRARGAWRNWRATLQATSDDDLFLWSWLIVGFLLLYIPTDFQIHMLNAWQVPVGLLAVRYLFRWLKPRIAPRRVQLLRWLPLLLIVLVVPTNLYLLAWRVLDLSRHEAPFYLSSDEQQALEWLGANATHEHVVLSGLNLGQYTPVYSDARTFLGHWAQTVDFYGKQAAVKRFFSAETGDDIRQTLVERFKVSYVIYGPEERMLGTFDPSTAPWLTPAFSSADVVIYQVR